MDNVHLGPFDDVVDGISMAEIMKSSSRHSSVTETVIDTESVALRVPAGWVYTPDRESQGIRPYAWAGILMGDGCAVTVWVLGDPAGDLWSSDLHQSIQRSLYAGGLDNSMSAQWWGWCVGSRVAAVSRHGWLLVMATTGVADNANVELLGELLSSAVVHNAAVTGLSAGEPGSMEFRGSGRSGRLF